MRWFKGMWLAVLAMFIVSTTAFAGAFVAVEYSTGDQQIDGITELSISAPVYDVRANVTSNTSDIDIDTYLISLGYKINEFVTPYILIGQGSVKFDRTLEGSITSPWITGRTNLAASDFSGSEFMTGLGLTGDLGTLSNGLVFTYDIRAEFLDVDDESNIAILPEFTDISLPMSTSIEYRKFSGSIVASKEVEMKKFVKSITPFGGLKVSATNYEISDSINILDVASVRTESTYSDTLASAVLGVKAKINENWSAAVCGTIGDDEGITLKAVYAF